MLNRPLQLRLVFLTLYAGLYSEARESPISTGEKNRVACVQRISSLRTPLCSLAVFTYSHLSKGCLQERFDALVVYETSLSLTFQ